METIIDFIKDAKQVSINTEKFESLKELKLNVDVNKDEVYRSRLSEDTSCYFNMELGLNCEDTVRREVVYMQTIELFYPDVFSWRFNGKHIELIAKIPAKKENLGIISRYKGYRNFISLLRERVISVLKYRDFTNGIDVKYVNENIYATGSLNMQTNYYVINIKPYYSYEGILIKSKCRDISEDEVKEFDMKWWTREMNPDLNKPMPKNVKKYPILDGIFLKYPPCIKNLSKLKKKGNYNRFLLGTFLLGVHHERDAKHQLDLMLSDKERNHINKGNCKAQWRTIVAGEYYPPSCKTMVESGFCEKDCGRAAPIILEKTTEVV